MNPMVPCTRFTVLHYLGCDEDSGGIVSLVRTLAGEGRFECLLGVNIGARQRRVPPLPVVEFPPLSGETLGLFTFWRTFFVARKVRSWLDAGPCRVFHGHSRAGLAVGLWLRAFGERRAVVSVHCYGRQVWFYRWAARRMGARLFWLSPEMKRYYGVQCGIDDWAQCVPGCVPVRFAPKISPRSANDGRLTLGGVGALVAWKRWDLVLDALALLPAHVRQRVRFIHIGASDGTGASSQYARELALKTTRLGLEKTVEWRGPQPTSEALLEETDCLLVVSKNEPFSVALLEALAAGVPVLAADSGGARDALAGGGGWLFRSGDARDLSREIGLLFQKKISDQLINECPKIERFAATTVAKQWGFIYTRTTGGLEPDRL